MKNPEGNIGDVYFGEKAEEALLKANKKQEGEVNQANEWVDSKVVENQIVPNLDGKMTYGDLFKDNKSELPAEINNILKFKKWYDESLRDAA